MPNREYEQVRRDGGHQGFGPRDEREPGGRDERWGQNQEHGGWGAEERWGRGEERGQAERFDRWNQGRLNRGGNDERWNMQDRWNSGSEPYGAPDRWNQERFGGNFDERWRNMSGMGGYDRDRGFGRGGYDEPWNRGRQEERYYNRDLRQHPFGFQGTDRGFAGGGYGGYGHDPYSSSGGYWAREGGFHPGRYGSQDYGWNAQRDQGQMDRGRPMGRPPRSYTRSDERIKEDLCDRLMQSWIDAENVDIQVKQGEVILSGTVDHRGDKRAIEDFAEQVLGVKDVQNQIRVRERSFEHQAQSPSSTATTKKPSA